MTDSDSPVDELFTAQRLPSLLQAIICFTGVFLLISLGMFVYAISIHAILFLA